MFDRITAAAISFVPRKWDVRYNLARLTALIRQAAAASPTPDLILAPEGTTLRAQHRVFQHSVSSQHALTSKV